MKFVPELEAILKSKGSAEFAAKVLALAKPGVFLRKRYETITTERPAMLGFIKRKPKQTRRGLPIPPGASRLGGLPELPKGRPWPSLDGQPMQFVAQINCAELAEHREHTLLPNQGTLHFFFEWEGSESVVTYTPADVAFTPVEAPNGIKSPQFVLSQFPVEFVLIPTFPHSDTKQFAPLDSDELEVEAFFDAHDTWSRKYLETQYGETGALHQIGGYPKAIQGDVWTECEMITRGNIASTDRELWKRAAEDAHRWRLLLQFDTDDDMNVMWGDAGTIYFCIREDDLLAGRFDKVCSTGQCG